MNSTDDLQQVELTQGKIRYRDTGSGEPLVFLHGLLVNGTLWRKVTPSLETKFRCVVPDLPLGSHSVAMRRDADLSPLGVAHLIADFLSALGLERVTVVGNDTGGALSQLVAAHHPERLGRLVLTPCDAYENFLPPAFRPMQYAAKVPGLLPLLLQPARLGAVQRSPLGFGMLIKHRPLDADVISGWFRPFFSNAGVRRDAVKFVRQISSRDTLDAAERLRRFDRPTLIAWAPEDRFFKLRYAERLAAEIPDARLETIEDSSTFVSEDQPERVAELLEAFVRETSGQSVAAHS
jgi:pimeloyl-ACP methyl ester carboxylesterase